MIHFGAYLVAMHDVQDLQGGLLCQAGELVLVFSRHRDPTQQRPVDLLLEDGRTLLGLPYTSITRSFCLVDSDPDFVICGCSTHDGWARAKAKLGKKA